MGDSDKFTFHDLAPTQESFRDAVIAGLRRDPKSLPCKFFYDARGSALFEKICELPEYYLTRTEIAILDRFAADIATQLGPALPAWSNSAAAPARRCASCSRHSTGRRPMSRSTSRASSCASRRRGWRPISRSWRSSRCVLITPGRSSCRRCPVPDGKRVGFFPGSTIGNFEPQQVVAFLSDWAALLGPGGEMLIGADLKKDPKILNAAYNDKAGSMPPSTSIC
jgi:hypothetical protein